MKSKMLYASTLSGAKSMLINLQLGYDVSIEFLDKSGNSWPVDVVLKGVLKLYQSPNLKHLTAIVAVIIFLFRLKNLVELIKLFI